MFAAVAWSEKGVKPQDIADGSFKFVKLASGHVNDDSKSKAFMSWGFIELDENQMKRAKNSSSMQLVFHVQSGAVEIRVHENVLIVRRGGVFQVPRGKSLLSFEHTPRTNMYDGGDNMLNTRTRPTRTTVIWHVSLWNVAQRCTLAWASEPRVASA